ncbi:MAG: hypothetical protein KJP21_08860, partial [Bacteroidia bacterium]|nr:hypothetical protein [Bacteroidia bacterium]
MKISLKLMSTFTIALLLSFNTAIADEWDSEDYTVGKLYKGYVISKSGDTTHGYIKALRYYGSSNETTNQTACYYYENEEDTEPYMTYKPAALKGYKIGDKLYHSIPYSGGLISKVNNFCLVRNIGAISQFSYFWYDDGSSGSPNSSPGIKESHLLRKGNDKVINEQSLAFG